jgi:hypothetical protein
MDIKVQFSNTQPPPPLRISYPRPSSLALPTCRQGSFVECWRLGTAVVARHSKATLPNHIARDGWPVEGGGEGYGHGCVPARGWRGQDGGLAGLVLWGLRCLVVCSYHIFGIRGRRRVKVSVCSLRIVYWDMDMVQGLCYAIGVNLDQEPQRLQKARAHLPRQPATPTCHANLGGRTLSQPAPTQLMCRWQYQSVVYARASFHHNQPAGPRHLWGMLRPF